MRSKETIKYKRIYSFTWLLHILLNIAPIAIYIIKALIEANLTTEKVTLCSTVFIALILSVVSWVNNIAMRSRLWIVLIGLYICLKSLITPLMIIAVCQVVDELIVAPVMRSARENAKINAQIDKRM